MRVLKIRPVQRYKQCLISVMIIELGRGTAKKQKKERERERERIRIEYVKKTGWIIPRNLKEEKRPLTNRKNFDNFHV
jgi:hypothetical protein